jgi:hypothetical protein
MAINMSYCRYENTFLALKECLDSDVDENELSKSEKMYRDRLIFLMRDFVDCYCEDDDLGELPELSECM